MLLQDSQQINELAKRYGQSSPEIQQIVSGFIAHKTNKDNPKYLEMMTLDTYQRSLFLWITEIQEQCTALATRVRYTEDEREKKQNSRIVIEIENQIDAAKIEYRQNTTRLQKLGTDFDFPVFTKNI